MSSFAGERRSRWARRWPLFPSGLAVAGVVVYRLVRLLVGKEEESADSAESVSVPPLAPAVGSEALLRLRLLVSTVGLLVWPPALVGQARQIAGNDRTVHRAVEEPGDYHQRVGYSLPFVGQWYVFNGGPDRQSSHSWEVVAQRYAYDFVIVDKELKRWREGTEGRKLEDHLCYGEPVLVPAEGVVVETRDDIRDAPRPGTGWLDFFASDICGNCVVIEHAEDEYSVLAHLIPGSIGVREGERVERGREVGRCGNSGNSSEPHLHFHVQDRAEFFEGAGFPVAFDDVAVDDGEPETGYYPKRGERVCQEAEGESR